MGSALIASVRRDRRAWFFAVDQGSYLSTRGEAERISRDMRKTLQLRADADASDLADRLEKYRARVESEGRTAGLRKLDRAIAKARKPGQISSTV